jgi:hypothetical protein
MGLPRFRWSRIGRQSSEDLARGLAAMAHIDDTADLTSSPVHALTLEKASVSEKVEDPQS